VSFHQQASSAAEGARQTGRRVPGEAGGSRGKPGEAGGSVRGVQLGEVLQTFRQESAAFSAAIGDLSVTEWDQPTRCEPWSVRELVAHVSIAVARVTQMLAAPPSPPTTSPVTTPATMPAMPPVSALGYYRPDHRFSAEANSTRVQVAGEHAARLQTEPALAEDFEATWQHVAASCAAEPEGRLVRTRHGDVMYLSQFLATRVIEVAVHGIDVADAVRRPAWVTTPAHDLVRGLLFGRAGASALDRFGWDRAGFLRRATGRQPLDAAEADLVAQLGMEWLTLG